MKICVIGGGLFGSMAAIKLANKGHSVDLIEKNDNLLAGASKHNHNRVHFGYHYLRSIKTALESREGLPSFMGIFGSAFLTNFPNYYCMATEGSKSTPQQFEEFCNEVDIGWFTEQPSEEILNPMTVAACYRVPEPVFDFFQLYRVMDNMLKRSAAKIFLSAEVKSIQEHHKKYSVTTGLFTKDYDIVINATYSHLNRINEMVGLPRRTYLFEDVVIPILHYAHQPFGITIMDGGFCSVEPYGFKENEFLLYHVKYSVVNQSLNLFEIETNVSFDEDLIINKSSEFLPFINNCEIIGLYRSIRIVKESDDDARLSIVTQELPNFWSILSGKVTTCVDVANKLTNQISEM